MDHGDVAVGDCSCELYIWEVKVLLTYFILLNDYRVYLGATEQNIR